MKTTYRVEIHGNDSFYTILKIEASNIELALNEALKQLDSYQKLTIERLRITSISERPFTFMTRTEF